MSVFSRTDKSLLGRWWWTVDRVTLTVFFILAVFGIVLVTTASPAVAERVGFSRNHYIIQHMVFMVPALFAIIAFSMMSLQQVWRAALLILGASMALMLLVLFVGPEIKGAQRWISLAGFSLQPSEFAKPAFLVVASWLIARAKEKPEFPGMQFAAGLYGGVLCLLLLQPDMGMSFVVTTCFLGIVFLAGFPFRWIFLMVMMAVGGMFLAYFSFSHVQSRVDRFLNPESGDTYQIDRAMEAFQNGGVFGTGPGQGTVKATIPDAHTDFIFAVAGEELGLVFLVILVGLYAYVLVRGYNRIMDTDNMFVILGAGSILTLFGLQALINIGSSLHLLPTKGMTLPLISYGGSSLLSTGIAMGMLLALTRRQARSGIARGGLSIRPIGGGS